MAQGPDEGLPESGDRPALGAELIIPVMAIVFAGYFLLSTTELVWEARANGVVIGSILILLVILQVARIFHQVRGGEATLSMGELGRLSPMQLRRIGLIALMALFVATVDLVGTCLGLFLSMASCMWVMRVRDPRWLVGLPAATSLVVYLLFIAFLGSRLPRGPVEHVLGAIFGIGAS